MTDSPPLTGVARAQVPARLLDLSEGGALLALIAPLTVGDVHDFALELDAQTVRVRALVRRCESSHPTEGFHIGVEFVRLDPAHERLLRQYLDGLQPLS